MEFYMFIFVVLLRAEYGILRSLNILTIECDWSVERWHCPVYGTTPWVCLKERKSCSGENKYHCVRDETGNWIQVCAEPKTCLKGQEPTFSNNSGITCTTCRNKDRYEPSTTIESYKYSECRQKKMPCPKDISYECPTGNNRYFQNTMCRCANEKNFIPQNYDLNTDTWSCQDADKLKCVEDPCPEDASGRPQIRNKEYRCFVPKFTITSRRLPESSTRPSDITEKSTKTSNQKVGSENKDNGLPVTVIIAVTFVMIVSALVGILGCLKKRKQTRYLKKRKQTRYRPVEDHTGYCLEETDHTGYLKKRKQTRYCLEETDHTVHCLKKRKQTVPGEPQRLQGNFDDEAKSFLLKWDLPEDDGGIPILKFKIDYLSDGDWTPAGEVKGDTTELLQGGLIGGMRYRFRVTAYNKLGPSKPAITSDALTYLSVPSKPASIYATDIKSKQLTLKWNRPENEGGTIVLRYYIRQKQGDNMWQDICDVLSSSNCSKTIQNLLPAKDYYFSVSAENKIGKSEFKEMESPVTMKRQIDVPEIPVGPLKVSDIKPTSLKLSWKPPEDTGASVLTGYVIEKKSIRWKNRIKIPPENTEYHFKGLKAGKKYLFRVSAESSHGSSQFLEMEQAVTTLEATKPGKPEGPIILSNMTPKSVTVSWKPPADDCGSEVTGYRLGYSDVSKGSDKGWIQVIVKETRYKQNDLPVDGEYCFRVSAVNAKGDGDSLYSSEKFIPIQHKEPGKPEGPIILSKMTPKSVTVSWKPPADDCGSEVIGYRLGYCDVSKGSDKCWIPVDIVKETRYIQNNLPVDGEYCFRVSAVNAKGDGDFLYSREKFIPIQHKGKPHAPGKLQIMALDAPYIQLLWTRPDFDGGSKLVNFVVKSKEENSDSWIHVENVKPSVLSFKVRAERYKKMYYSVAAENDAGVGPAAETEEPVEPHAPPSRPTGLLVASEINDDHLTLSWQPPNYTGGSPVKKYFLQKKEPNAMLFTGWSTNTVIPGDKTKVRVEDLAANTEYCFRISAGNITGGSEPLEMEKSVFTKRLTNPPPPLGPIKYSEVTEKAVTLSWEPPESDGSAPVIQYKIEHKFKNDPESLWRESGYISNQTNWTQHDLLAEQEYLFRVIAINKKGESKPLVSEIVIRPVLTRGFFQNVIDAAKAKLTTEMDSIVVLDGLRRYKIGTEQDYKNIQTEKRADRRNEKLLQIIKANGIDAYKQLKIILAETMHTDLMAYLKEIEEDLQAGTEGAVEKNKRTGRLEVAQEDNVEDDEDQRKEEKAQKLLEVLKSIDTWDKFIIHAAGIDLLLKGCLEIPTGTVTDLKDYSELKIEANIPHGFKVYKCKDQGNSLFNSLSLILYGSENFTYRLRLAATSAGILNFKFYIKQYLAKKDREAVLKFMKPCLSEISALCLSKTTAPDVESYKNLAMQKVVRETAMPESKCNPLQVQFLSSATGYPILQYFQKNTEDFCGNSTGKPDLVQPVVKKGTGKNSNICILWIHEKMSHGGKMVNRVLPVIGMSEEDYSAKQRQGFESTV